MIKPTMIEWMEKAYPSEGCGFISTAGEFVPMENAIKTQENAPIPKERLFNSLKGFAFNPAEFNEKTRDREIEYIVHSHPDCEAIPSKIDRAQPFAKHWKSIILSIKNGKFDHMGIWNLNG